MIGAVDGRVVVVGAGPAGISMALALKDLGERPILLDKAETVASSWRGRYDRLRLNTSRPLSHLPNRRFPKGTPLFPTRDQLVEHLERHAHEDGIDLRLGIGADRIERGDGSWNILTTAGELTAEQVVIATGYENKPFIPDWPGRSAFQGRLLHSSEYKNPFPYEGKKVLVVGPGCSGMEIAYDLAEGGAEKVWLAVRTPPNILLRASPGPVPNDFVGVPLLRFPVGIADRFTRLGQRMDFGDLSEYGLPFPDDGVFSRIRSQGAIPTIIDKEVIEAIKARRFDVVGAVEGFDPTGVMLHDGRHLEPDLVISATGYTRHLEPLVGHLGVLDEQGRPRKIGEEPAAPGLRFIGYVPRPGALGYMAKESTLAARAIARELPTANTSVL
jgi:cation diffusion facilitator CzcD-associated flavoprotein CzcO